MLPQTASWVGTLNPGADAAHRVRAAPPAHDLDAACTELRQPFRDQPADVHCRRPQNKELDFFIVHEPEWLDEKFSSLAKQVRRPCAALVSTDQMWIT